METLMESKLPKTLNDLAVMDKLPRGAYVDLPDRSAAWFVESVQKLADEVYTVNHRNDVLFTGFENVVVYFDVRSFAEVMREIFTHRIIQYGGMTEANWDKAQKDTAAIRKRLERAYASSQQKGEYLDVWLFGMAAYKLFVEEHQRFDNILGMSLTKLALKASEIGQAIEAKAKQQGEVAYFFPKR
jgi:hypothetical protein